jgi:branched-chain amino acid aminotransferase
MTPFSASLASIDGLITLASEAMVPATDEGLLRGDGAFEVIRVYDGHAFALEEHLRRLERSASNLRLPLDIEAVRADANRLLAHAGGGTDHEALRVVITRGGRRLLLTEPVPEMLDSVRLASLTYSPSRILDGVKSLSYAANMLASRLARERGFDEALLVTPHGRVLEAPTSSIFWVKDGEVFTPPLDEHILASITRRIVIEHSGAMEKPVTLEELGEADEAFLASTLREVQAISAIDEQLFGVPRPLTDQIAAKVGQAIRAEVGPDR